MLRDRIDLNSAKGALSMPTRLVSGEAQLPKLSYLSYTTKKQILKDTITA